MEGHIPWFRDPKPKGTNPKGPKENSLIIVTSIHIPWRGAGLGSKSRPRDPMSYSLNSLKGGYIGDYIGDYHRAY